VKSRLFTEAKKKKVSRKGAKTQRGKKKKGRKENKVLKDLIKSLLLLRTELLLYM